MSSGSYWSGRRLAAGANRWFNARPERFEFRTPWFEEAHSSREFTLTEQALRHTTQERRGDLPLWPAPSRPTPLEVG
jgi:hypothetical protein